MAWNGNPAPPRNLSLSGTELERDRSDRRQRWTATTVAVAGSRKGNNSSGYSHGGQREAESGRSSPKLEILGLDPARVNSTSPFYGSLTWNRGVKVFKIIKLIATLCSSI
uniref:Uncharacterized protein n=1 Tax=Opuntia streptacantha TaxID=393608 RepID=A0A7C9AAK8_OPUST